MPAPSYRLPKGFRSKAIALLVFGGFISLYLGAAMDPRALALGIVVLAVLVVGLCVPWLQTRLVGGAWEFGQRRGQVGRKLPVRLRLANRGLPAGGLVVHAQDVLPVQEHSSVLIPLLAGFRNSLVELSVVPARRGLYTPERKASLVTGFPFGFAQARRMLEVTSRVLVWPATIPLTGSGSSSSQAALAADVADSRQPGTSGHVSGARPYRDGESLRRIHWPQTARLDRLIVCERSRPEARGATIFVETDPEVHDDGESSTIEFAISLGASLAEGFAKQGRQVTLITGNGRAWHTLTRAGLTQLMDGLAALDTSRSVPLRELLLTRGGGDSEAATEFVVTTAAGFARCAEAARERGRVVVIDNEASASNMNASAGLHRLPVMPLRDRRLQSLAQELLHVS